MSKSEEQIFIKDNIIQSQEYLSPSKRYKIIIETYKTGNDTWNYTKGTIYSCSTNHWVGEIRRNYPHLPHLFFSRSDIQGTTTEYLISGRDYTSQTIINCETGHIYDNTDDKGKDPFCWSQMWQVDTNTLCVLGCYWGGSYVYSFFDFSNLNLGWKRLDVKRSNGLPMPKYDYILTNNDLVGQKNYPDPIVENGSITFGLKETRIFGIGINSYEMKEIDMEINDYNDQENVDEGFKIPYSKFKTYEIDTVRMRYRRVDDHIELFEFWRDERQMEKDQSFDPEEPMSIRCKNIYNSLDKLIHRYNIRCHTTSDDNQFKWNILVTPKYTRTFHYLIEFGDEINTEIRVNYYNFRFKEQNRILTVWDETGIIDLIQ
jgi:hypothetical protein